MSERSDFELISDIIRKRRAIFPVQFNDASIDTDFIDQLLELANWAPTHRRTEPWRFVIISGAAKERLGDFMARIYQEITPVDQFKPTKQLKFKTNCRKSQYIILIQIQRDEKQRVPEWEEIAAVAMAVQNMWLACSAAGIGCYWSSPGLMKHMGRFIDQKEGESCLGLFYVGGFSDQWPKGHRQPMVDKVTYLTV
jgi:nitroreductase